MELAIRLRLLSDNYTLCFMRAISVFSLLSGLGDMLGIAMTVDLIGCGCGGLAHFFPISKKE